MDAKKKVAVLGAGSWGTALAHHLCGVGHHVLLWGRDRAVLEEINQQHKNSKYFEGLKLADALQGVPELKEALLQADVVVFAVPSGALRELAREAKQYLPENVLVVSTAKGLELDTRKTMTTVLEEELGKDQKIAVLSGPSFAKEVVLGLPTAVTMAARDLAVAQEAAAYFHIDYFRVYTSTDVIGVELGGVVKNVIAIAVGVIDGMGMGTNARAALITRGLLEMQRLSLALGGQPTTVTGLSGLGDLLLTATGDLSRNRQVGLRLGRGEKLDDILGTLAQVAEGVRGAHELAEVAEKYQIRAPIIEEVSKIMSGETQAKESVKRLLSRAPATEGL